MNKLYLISGTIILACVLYQNVDKIKEIQYANCWYGHADNLFDAINQNNVAEAKKIITTCPRKVNFIRVVDSDVTLINATSPLSVALKKDNYNIIKLLLEHGARKYIKPDHQFINDLIKQKRTDLIKLFVQFGQFPHDFLFDDPDNLELLKLAKVFGELTLNKISICMKEKKINIPCFDYIFKNTDHIGFDITRSIILEQVIEHVDCLIAIKYLHEQNYNLIDEFSVMTEKFKLYKKTPVLYALEHNHLDTVDYLIDVVNVPICNTRAMYTILGEYDSDIRQKCNFTQTIVE
ncbi:MAG: hypothetical protein Edafosvirus1_35 [Edafosvirus sp.]|uniref:Uncharacterized protein n=1 Tax=Edafosvirus sp. TaxID=2487765 RepID=A0A3G4ZTP7_9VIRU|nr:MAG: hypothetical protein Edafosvirus1_35 [Edafosvirus sp.]